MATIAFLSAKTFGKRKVVIPFTTEEYWDCECEKNYIHPKSDATCLKCGCAHEDRPDSHTIEVLAAGLPINSLDCSVF